MLDKNSKNILKFLIKQKGNLFCVTDKTILEKKLNINSQTVDKSIEYLKELNLIEYWNEFPDISKFFTFIFPTIKGFLYFKEKRYNTFITILNSFIFPTIVSLITTLIALALKPQ